MGFSQLIKLTPAIGVLMFAILGTKTTIMAHPTPPGEVMNPSLHTYMRIHMEKAKEHARQRFDNIDQLYPNVSQNCYRDMRILHAALTQAEIHQWALMWNNANGRGTYGTEMGSLLGNTNALGSFDLCQQVKASNQSVSILGDSGENVAVGRHDFNTRYCGTFHQFDDVDFFEGWCLAETCNKEDILGLMPDYPPSKKHVFCEDERLKTFSGGAVITVFVLSLFVAFVLGATTFDGISDLLLKQRKLQSFDKDIELDTSQKVDKAAVVESSVHQQDEKEQGQPGPVREALLCFSLYKTLPLVLIPTSGGYGAVYGLRVIAISWIVLGHSTYLKLGKRIRTENYLVVINHADRLEGQIIDDLGLPVDIFFMLSGCLATLSLLQTIEQLKRSGACERLKAFLLYVFHRYLRLTPVYAVVIMIWGNLWPYFGSGPLYPNNLQDADNCKTYWWMNLLYINNFASDNHDTCMEWGWYLATDFQFYFIAPVFVILLYWKPKIGGVILGLGWLGNDVARGLIAVQPSMDTFWDIYVKPWGRFGVYAQGIAIGYIIYRTKSKVKIHWALVWVGWLLAATLCLLVIYGPYKMPQSHQLTFHIFHRDAFGIGIAWILFACVSGHGGLINSFLSWSFFQPLARLSYCVFLLHPIVHLVYHFRRHTLWYIQDITIIYAYLGTLCLTLMCALGITVVFEVPFLMLEKVIIPSRRQVKNK